VRIKGYKYIQNVQLSVSFLASQDYIKGLIDYLLIDPFKDKASSPLTGVFNC